METERIKFESGKLTYFASELGIWTAEKNFIPLSTIQYFQIVDSQEKNLIVAYSAKYQWGYITTERDDLVQFLDTIIEKKDSYKVAEGEAISGLSSNFLDLENGKKFEYSYRTSMLLIFKNKGGEKKISNELWLEDWILNERFKGVETEPYELSEEEIQSVEDSKDYIPHGQFDKQVSGTSSFKLGCLIAIILIVIGIIIGVISPEYGW